MAAKSGENRKGTARISVPHLTLQFIQGTVRVSVPDLTAQIKKDSVGLWGSVPHLSAQITQLGYCMGSVYLISLFSLHRVLRYCGVGWGGGWGGSVHPTLMSNLHRVLQGSVQLTLLSSLHRRLVQCTLPNCPVCIGYCWGQCISLYSPDYRG